MTAVASGIASATCSHTVAKLSYTAAQPRSPPKTEGNTDQAVPIPRRRSRETALDARQRAKTAPTHAMLPMMNARPWPRKSVLLDTPYAITINGSVARADACCAAAALDTRAEIARITASARAMNGGSTQSTRIHQLVVGKNQPPSFGPTMRFTTSEYIANPVAAVK